QSRKQAYSEKVSGAKTDRKALAKAIAAPRAGDALLVTRLDQLARVTSRAKPDLTLGAILPAAAAACTCGGAGRSVHPGRRSSRLPCPTLRRRARPSRAIAPPVHSRRLCWRL
ncbi:hypothetical protein EGT07_31950, partial [Herbaspirillum sp. HC18]